MVRNNPLRSGTAHIGIIGHITKDELLRYLTATELANGFQNRFLLVAVDRSKLLPFGSALDADQLAEVSDAVRLGLRFAGAQRALPLDPAARERWIDIYPQLSASQPRLAGAATARAEAHVVRLALIYALLDCSDTIGHDHLEAALAVWRYSADSASWIVGDSLGDPTADEIWAATKHHPAGVTRTDVSDMFSRNKKRREIERALTVLEEAGRLRREIRHPERGRPAEIWVPLHATAA
jgi:DNA replicative helicase MCM subunit Mcm2 (Cdc46/Mcm family)